jgi:Icc-related predicted phosphoesterase
MKVCAISDLHGKIWIKDLNINADILCIAGDFIPLNIQRDIPASKSWFKNKFIPALQKLNVDEIFIIGGNHDFLCEKDPTFIKDSLQKTNINYLQDDLYKYISKDGSIYTIYGTPWCHKFGNWAFMVDDDTLKEKFSNIPKDLDILITHDPPTLGKVGTINQGYNTGYNAGCKELSDAIRDTWPRLVISGHIHTGNHNLDEIHLDSNNGKVNLCTTKFINVSLLDENYFSAFNPAYFNFDVDHEIKLLETNN